MTNRWKGLISGEEGQGITEYGLILGVIAVGAVALLVNLRAGVTQIFTNFTDELDEAYARLNGQEG